MTHDSQTTRPKAADDHPPRNHHSWVIIGGGRLGRGFLNDVADDLDLHSILFVAGQHTPRSMVASYNQQRVSGTGYRILAAPDFAGRRALCNYTFHIAIDTSVLITALCSDTTEIVSTSVGLNNLGHVAPYIAEGLRRRAESNLPKLTILVCENGRTVLNESPADYLSKLVDTHLKPLGLTCNQTAIIPQTVVECAVPALPASPSSPIYRSKGIIWVDDTDEIPDILRRSRFIRVSNDMGVIRTRKLYAYNSLHCFLSVLGHFYGQPNVQVVADEKHLTLVFEHLKDALCEAIRSEHEPSAITAVETNDKDLAAYADASLSQLRQPLADTLDPVSRALEKVCNGWYLNDGRILGPARSLGLFDRPWKCPVLVHMISLCLYLYVKTIDSVRNRLPFLSHAFINDVVQTDGIDFVKLEDDFLCSLDAENFPITEVLAHDLQQLQLIHQEQDSNLYRLDEFLRRPIKEPIIPVPRSCKRATIKCVVFDLDEGLVSTEHILYEVTKSILKDYATCQPDHLSHEAYARHVGQSEEEFFETMRRDFCIRDLNASDLVKEREDRFADQIRKADRHRLIKPGFGPLLSFLASYGVLMAIHSNASRRRVDVTLEHTGLEMFFAEVRSATDRGMRAKPDPTMLLDILKTTRSNPRDCIVVESSCTGVLSSLNAGCHCVLIFNEYTSPEPVVDRKGVTVVANARQLSSWFVQLTGVHKSIGRCTEMPDQEWREFRRESIRRCGL